MNADAAFSIRLRSTSLNAMSVGEKLLGKILGQL